MKTYCFKLYKAKRNKKIHNQINAASLIYNHCIALHKRYYRLFGKSLKKYDLQKHLTKLKKINKFSYLLEIGSQAVQDITDRIDRAYKLFFNNLKKNGSSLFSVEISKTKFAKYQQKPQGKLSV